MVAGLINTITDFCCTVLPAFVVVKLQLPKKQKIAVASVFLCGVIVNVASALRIYLGYVQSMRNDSWDMLGPLVSGCFEIGLGVVRSFAHLKKKYKTNIFHSFVSISPVYDHY